jgi:hypothetical protein
MRDMAHQLSKEDYKKKEKKRKKKITGYVEQISRQSCSAQSGSHYDAKTPLIGNYSCQVRLELGNTRITGRRHKLLDFQNCKVQLLYFRV